MDPERSEVYERIPWESLDKKKSDRQWLVYLGAGAITLGALAYSFVRNQPVTPTAGPGPVATAPTPTTGGAVDSSATATPPNTPTTVVSPVLFAEADLFALDPGQAASRAAAHAEWFAIEYFSFDGAESDLLRQMLPPGAPLPAAPEGTQVFVDWVRARAVTQTSPLGFEVEVLVRSLLSIDGDGFTRQPVRLVVIPVELGGDGEVGLAGLPVVSAVGGLAAPDLDDLYEIATETGPDGVVRPVAVP